MLAHDIQSVVFARTRRSVEIILTYLQGEANTGRQVDTYTGKHADNATRNTQHESRITNYPFGSRIRGYRSGYLPHQRREVEHGLRDGSVKTVVATNALELGIDIGGLGAAILVGYPGTIASARQQAGRAGRGDDPAVSVLVASPNPLDQFLATIPNIFLAVHQNLLW